MKTSSPAAGDLCTVAVRVAQYGGVKIMEARYVCEDNGSTIIIVPAKIEQLLYIHIHSHTYTVSCISNIFFFILFIYL